MQYYITLFMDLLIANRIEEDFLKNNNVQFTFEQTSLLALPFLFTWCIDHWFSIIDKLSTFKIKKGGDWKATYKV